MTSICAGYGREGTNAPGKSVDSARERDGDRSCICLAGTTPMGRDTADSSGSRVGESPARAGAPAQREKLGGQGPRRPVLFADLDRQVLRRPSARLGAQGKGRSE